MTGLTKSLHGRKIFIEKKLKEHNFCSNRSFVLKPMSLLFTDTIWTLFNCNIGVLTVEKTKTFPLRKKTAVLTRDDRIRFIYN